MLKKLYCSVTIALLTITIWGQQPTQTQALIPKVIPGTPEATGIAKYGNYPVNMYTGVPSISIPLYEIQVGELNVPISLNYHASGLKVSEIPSRTGLGWSLSSGGTISRKMMSKPDEQDAGYLSGPTVKITTEINPSVSAGLDYLKNINQGFSDVEPDIFSYNVPGKSGTFLFNQRDNFNILTLPYHPIKIARTHPNQSIMLLAMTDEKGIDYKFDTYEWTNSSSGSSMTNAISAWMLSKMVSSNKQDTIYFNYAQKSTGSGTTDHYFSEVTVVNDEVWNLSGHSYYSPDFGSTYTSDTWISTIWQMQSEILFKNGKVVFESAPEARQDFAQFGTAMPNRLNAIRVYSYDKLSNSYRLIKSILFYHSYFISGTDATTKRLRLDSLAIMSSGGAEIQKYRFEYNIDQLLPSRISKAKDYWGYFNNKSNNFLTPRMQIIHLSSQGSPPNNIWIGSDILDGREPDPSYMQANILTKIFYPTGGKTEFEYETNKYIDAQSNVKNAGGLRIKKIKNYDGISASPIVRTYKYGVNESGNGRANFKLNTYFFQTSQTNQRWQVLFPPQCPTLVATMRVRTFFSSPTIDIEPYDGSPVGYATVTEYTGDETTNTGKTIYQFNDQGDGMNVVAAYGRPIITSYHMNRGQVLTRTVYKKNSMGQFQKIAATTNQYEAFPEQFHAYLGLVVFKWRIPQGTGGDLYLEPEFPPSCGGYNDSYNYMYSNYSIRTADDRLRETVETIYDENDETKFATTTTNYYYDNFNHMQVTRIQKTTSKGETILNTLKYPHDYPGILPYTAMIPANIINKVVEDRQTNNGVQTHLTKNNYTDWGNNNYLPQTIQLQKANNAIETRANFLKYDLRGNIQEMQKANDIKQSYIWNYQTMLPIAEVINSGESNIAYTSFEADGKGNWSYNGLQFTDGSAPTGKKVYNLGVASNISKSGLTAANTYIVSYWTKNTSAFNITGNVSGYPVQGRTLNGWRYFEHKITGQTQVTINGTGVVDELRLYPDKALMTTMTYEPLTGMTSQCDPNNRISYYEYDEFQRLILVRDQDKNIMKKICYNYSGQTENCTIYYNTIQQSTYTRNNCPSGYVGSDVTYVIPDGTYISTISPADANQKAWNDILANGQAYANALGTCTQSSCTPYNCTGDAYKCVYGFCEQGVKVYTYIEQINANLWTCTYHYEWSDGSWSQDYYEESSYPCQ